MRQPQSLAVRVIGLFVFAFIALAGTAPCAFAGAACPSATTVARDNWSVTYRVTPSDGLEVSDAQFSSTDVIRNARLMEWHSRSGAGTGFVFSTGCDPTSGGFAVYPFGVATVEDLPATKERPAGFEVVGDFRMSSWGANCNHRFGQRFQFFSDGSFRVVAAHYGRDCFAGASSTRPVLRIDLALDGDDDDTVAQWDGLSWAPRGQEFFRTPYAGANGPLAYDPAGYALRFADAATGLTYYMEPDRGQFGQAQADDQPFVYVTRYDAAEGGTDLSPLGTCCETDEDQGPQAFVNDENIDQANLVLWYVPLMVTDATGPDYFCWTLSGPPNPETYPCFAGPYFVSPNVDEIFADDFEE